MAASAYRSISLAITEAAPARQAASATMPRPGREIEYPPAGHDLRMIEHVPGQGLPTRPRKRPERRCETGYAVACLGLLPQRDGLAAAYMISSGTNGTGVTPVCSRTNDSHRSGVTTDTRGIR